jgi:hypothetical protein
MILRYRVTNRALALLVGPALLFVLGCSGGDGLGKRYAVTGKVTYKDQPVEKGVINFVPLDAAGHGASGQIEKGSYTLTTLTPADGALPGKYKVTVDTRQIDEAAAHAAAEENAKQKGITGPSSAMIPQDIQAKLLKQSKNSIPGKYQLAETTDLTATVEEHPKEIDFKLTD